MVSSTETLRSFLLNHIAALSRRFDVMVVANATDFGLLDPLGLSVTHASVCIERDIKPLRDLAALWQLLTLFRIWSYDAVYSITPKAGLLSMLAGWVTRVPVRVHTFTGQVWVTARGPLKKILRAADRLIAALATHVLADSHSQMEFLISERILTAHKACVLASGSISGVDIRRFAPNPVLRDATRAELGIDKSAVVFLFVGRLKRDKGVFDLAQAFVELSRVRADVHLVIVGRDEEGLRGPLLDLCRDCADRVSVLGHTDQPEKFMAAADVFCLPSHREGFGSVVIEAGAAGVPSIGSRICGITDAIEDNITGLLHVSADPASLLNKMLRMVDEPGLRRTLGANARARAIRDFPAERVTAALLEYLTPLL